jgi:periplasmic protein CpxP/Spy
MKNLGKIQKLALISLSSIALLASVVLAQNAGTDQGNRKSRPEWRGEHGGHRDGFLQGPMFKHLNLTEDQKAQMKQISESFRERTRTLREQLRSKHEEVHQAMESGTFNEALATQKLTEAAGLQAKLMGEEFKQRQEMLAVLTPEQKTQLDQLRQQFKARRAEFKANRGERGTQ